MPWGRRIVMVSQRIGEVHMGNLTLALLHTPLLAFSLLAVMEKAPVPLLAFSRECRTLRHPCPLFYPLEGPNCVASGNRPGKRVGAMTPV